MADHGTYAGYQQHKKTGDMPACGPCLAANTAYNRARRARGGRSMVREQAYNRATAAARQELIRRHLDEYQQLLRGQLQTTGAHDA